MFHFIRRFLYNRSRKIFRFDDGRRVRWVDPVTAWREMLADPDFDIERDSALMDIPERAISEPAWLKCVACMRRVFNVAPVELGGLTETECVQLFKSFCVYVHALKKNSSTSPTKSEPTTGHRPQFGQHWEPMVGPDSISTPPESNFDAPAQLQTG